MRKKVIKTVKRACEIPDDNSVDPVAPPFAAASTPSGFPSTSADYTNNISHSSKFYRDHPKLPFKKRKGYNKTIVEPEHRKILAFTYQVAWNFQSSLQRSIFASNVDGSVTGTPNGPPIHRPFLKGQYLDALGKAVSDAAIPCSESVHKGHNSFGSLPLKQRTGFATESILLTSPVIPKGVG